MGELVFAALTPHPPVIVTEVGKGVAGKVQASRQAMRRVAQELEAAEPDTLIMITPHGAVFADAVSINVADPLRGDLARFGAPQVKGNYPNDLGLGSDILKSSLKRKIPAVQLDDDLAREFGTAAQLDHGLMVPLSFFREVKADFSLVPVNMGLLPREELYLFGAAVQEAIKKSSRRAAVIASGDLSHRVTREAPGGFHPRGREFDLRVKELLEDLDVPGIINLPDDLVEQVGECGLRPLIMLLGALDGHQVNGEVLSYEAPFGVGYLVARFKPGQADQNRVLGERFFREREKHLKKKRSQESPLVNLARRSLEHYLSTGKLLKNPRNLPKDLPDRAGVFVSLKKHGQLRGCIGTIGPTEPDLAQEIIANAVKAGMEDPRFSPVEREEIGELTYSVDVLGHPEPIQGIEELDPQKYGVIVKSGWHSGLLLPDLAGIDTAEEQVAIARRKAGIGPEEPVHLERFTVTRYV